MRRRFMKLNVQEEENTYMYIQALSYGLSVSFSSNNIEYSIDNIDNWETLEADTQSPIINKGQKIYFRASILPTFNFMGIGTFSINRRCSIGGNVMSLLFGDNFLSENSLEGYARVFYRLFENCYTIERVSPTLLPATTLADYCYELMFEGCTNLVNAPELPATDLAASCYFHMFHNCINLVNAPALPATSLADNCYGYMFEDCSSLTTAPVLPATTLADACYWSMFYACKSLVNAPELPATTLVEGCYNQMFYECTSLVNAPALPATTLADHCYEYMFSKCTSLVNAPALPATTLAQDCYEGMFFGCEKLTEAPALPATTLAQDCYFVMFSDCKKLTDAPELPATTLAEYCYGSMFKNCTSLNKITMLATDISANNCLHFWVEGVAATGTFTKATSMTTLPENSTSGIPTGWTIVNDGEESGGIINFTIDEKPYQAEEGMTWEEWVNSSYNTGGYYKYFDSIVSSTKFYVSTEEDYVSPSDIILEDYRYLIVG